MRRLGLVPVVLLVALGALIAGCGGGPATEGAVSDSSDATRPTLRYFPLAVDNSWTTRVNQYAAAPAGLALPVPGLEGAASDDPSLALTSSFSVTGTQMIGGAKWFVGGYTPPIPSQEPWLGRHNTSGLLIKVTNSGTPYYLLKAPLMVGTTWDLTPLYARRAIMSINASTTVPAGTFTGCIKVKQTYTTPSMADVVVTYWFAPGVGVARTEIRDGGVLTTRMVLVSYTVKPI